MKPLYQCAAIALALTGAAFPVLAAEKGGEFPNRPVRIVLPTTPGSGVDITARAIAQKLSEAWSQPVIVDNRPGANGIIGMEAVAKANPDGYTWLQAFTSVLTINPYVYKSLPYDAQRDYAPITQTVTNTMALTVHPAVPAKSPKDLVALARAKPGAMSYASAGVGNLTHLTAELLRTEAGLKLLHVPYKGESNAFNALIGGEAQFLFSVALGVVPHVKAGRLRLLATCGETRATAFPETPTMVESGFPRLISTGWGGLLAPAGTPPAVLRRIQQETAKQLAAADLKERLSALGTEPVGSTPQEFSAFIKSEAAKWSGVVKDAGIANSQ